MTYGGLCGGGLMILGDLTSAIGSYLRQPRVGWENAATYQHIHTCALLTQTLVKTGKFRRRQTSPFRLCRLNHALLHDAAEHPENVIDVLSKCARAQNEQRDAKTSEPFQHLGTLRRWAQLARVNQSKQAQIVSSMAKHHHGYSARVSTLICWLAHHDKRCPKPRISICIGFCIIDHREHCLTQMLGRSHFECVMFSPRFQSVPGLKSRVSDTDLISAHLAQTSASAR